MIDRLLGKKVVGIKQVTKALNNDQGLKLYVAEDADSKITIPIVSIAEEKNIEIEYIATMKYLGKMCGIEVGSAATLILKE
ncbi:ribosomal L7Ae/L30e/S12e/Gadd45 family protein [Clostridium algidicarnis]|uniref:Large subunit ribosomal protein L7A n=2 Tax=Clostridium algidicarnis TaxID=37659 RepID=A0A2S6FY81_9CLOT|nr:ribosomal L7Ae/L30e/S12e/Gadd45 family protein [Clostridium algidicarnis]MBB6632438.1 ribosomal L7Ae/L30e/S12e/Gadd45 family protein [Clostridium algidicarnis]MBB6698062.1 ribosomal L7Ae/L30e/S12e/Gadd45 family protein [Clostridium algidicarnis]MBU3192584.1 ribosomal L7Ae/L30e/S12e/Gadd45 family protein [Clostridium algidicarnis]MBU3204233.1 ribosomal L7Ae/L30e/S12e/Gadd45 family protein [Clostridium algidicarnis]MBU3207079.1 ribosomal L7Ae/L30e/S12e/Gadd45 family protein [Clostridium algid